MKMPVSWQEPILEPDQNGMAIISGWGREKYGMLIGVAAVGGIVYGVVAHDGRFVHVELEYLKQSVPDASEPPY